MSFELGTNFHPASLIFDQVGQNGLQHIVRRFSSRPEKPKHFISDEFIIEYIWAVQHERQNVSVVAERAFSFTSTPILDVAFDPISCNITIALHFLCITVNGEKMSRVWVKPVGRVCDTFQVAISDLINNHED